MELSVCAREFSFFADLYRFQVYNGQSNYLVNMTSDSTFGNFGMPVDNILTDTSIAVSSQYFITFGAQSTDSVLGWNLFAAAMTTNEGLRSKLLLMVHTRASYNVSAGVFPVDYGSADGSTLGGVAR